MLFVGHHACNPKKKSGSDPSGLPKTLNITEVEKTRRREAHINKQLIRNDQQTVKWPLKWKAK